MSTFSKLMTSGSRCQLGIAGETIDHVSAGGETQSCLLVLPRNFVEEDRDIGGDVVSVSTGIFSIREADLKEPVTRLSKFVWKDVTYNVDDQAAFQRQSVYIDVPVYTIVPIRKGPEGHRRELMS